MSSEQPHLLLHTYFRSSCSARVRTALHLKNLSYEPAYIHLLKQDQLAPSYCTVNPSASVPTLTITPLPSSPNHSKIVIRQSLAILEFLDEYFPDTKRLLPEDAIKRARIRELVDILACDVQPLTNLRILRRVKKISKGNDEAVSSWAREIMGAGLEAYDKLVREGRKLDGGGRYSVGNEVTMADVCLAPAVEGALRYGVDVQNLEAVWSIYEELKKVDAFKKGGWRAQPDTPEEFREKE